MQSSSNQIETQKRLYIIREIDKYVADSFLSGLLVTGSLAWGKNRSVIESSDVDFYLLAPSLDAFKNSLEGLPNIPSQTKKILTKMLDYTDKPVDTRSIKTNIGPYFGAIYFFTEKGISQLVEQFNRSGSKFFKNLRPHNFSQTKEYKGVKGNKINFTTPIIKARNSDNLWIRTDPLFLVESKEFFGSIFLSHLLFGEAFTDKNKAIYKAQIQARKFLKSILPHDEERAFVLFKNYLPRIERMDNKIINDLFNSIWQS